MRVAGVVVGLSRQIDARIETLSFGARDATRLHALFADLNASVGCAGNALHLLTNETATVDAVRAALLNATEAARTGLADLLLVHFSCHGSPAGQLLLYDAIRDDLDNTALSLAEVSTSLAPAGAVSVVVTLDTCFSGTVLGMEGSPNEEGLMALMATLSSGSRAVVWAAGAFEEALESPKYAHGFLSYGLVQTLESMRAQGKEQVAVSSWLQGAIDHVASLAREVGRSQTPGQLFGGYGGRNMRVPPVGPNQTRFAQDVVGTIAISPDVADLTSYGFSPIEIDAVRSRLCGTGTL
jgi:ATP-dependent DNA helicase